MKKGFTMIELLTVIIIIGVLALLIAPAVTNIIKDSKEKTFNIQVKSIEDSAENFIIEYIDVLTVLNVSEVTIDLKLLKDLAYVDYQIKDPIENKYFSDDSLINIKIINNQYSVTLYPKTASTVSDDVKYKNYLTFFIGSNLETVTSDPKEKLIVIKYDGGIIDKSKYIVTRDEVTSNYQTINYSIDLTDDASTYLYQIKREEKI